MPNFKRTSSLIVICLTCYAFISGCIVRTYSVVKDRVDQEVSGNQGYTTGTASGSGQERKFTQRSTKVVEIELTSPIKFEKLKEPPKNSESKTQRLRDNSSEGNKGYMQKAPVTSEQLDENMQNRSSAQTMDTYIVQKNDTLQKISARPEIYGTTKKWMKIYEANKDKLSAPDKIYPGQEIKIPRDR